MCYHFQSQQQKKKKQGFSVKTLKLIYCYYAGETIL